MRRRSFLQALGGLLAVPAASVHAAGSIGAARTSGAAALLDRARALARRPWVAPPGTLPAPFADLDYDAYRAIRPIPGRAGMLPQGRDWAVDLLPPGLYFPDPVRIEVATPEGPRAVPFSPDLFDFDERHFDEVPDHAPGAGFSGLRLRSPLNAPDRLDEVLVMQGASYFRAVGRAMVYGLSARAVALGTGGPAPEEFPRFTELRLHAPAAGAIRLEAVIDSPSLAGHLDMRLQPGAATVMDLSVTLFPRVEIDDVGIAPLTSLYLKGPLRAAVSDDFRPRVHDSDVLYVENGAGEQLWRPIANPARIETSAFLDDAPRAFGLLQTARRFEDYEDSEARYHDRPSALVRPRGDWGRGAVMLVEIPTGDEFMDNVVAFWRPEAPLRAGGAHRFDYRLEWTRTPPAMAGPARILQTRSGREHDQPGARRYVIDFAGDAAHLRPDLSAGDGGEVSGMGLFPLPGDRGTRLTFLLTPGATDAVELRLALRSDTGRRVGPIWLHRWTRARDGGV